MSVGFGVVESTDVASTLMVNSRKRSMSMTPTWGTAAPNSSGRCSNVAPTSRPPFERPVIASLFGFVNFSRIRYSPAAAKSSKTFCLFVFMPASCQALPYSPPPRRFTTA